MCVSASVRACVRAYARARGNGGGDVRVQLLGDCARAQRRFEPCSAEADSLSLSLSLSPTPSLSLSTFLSSSLPLSLSPSLFFSLSFFETIVTLRVSLSPSGFA